VAKHSGPHGNSKAVVARSGTVSSPEALAVSSPERVRRAHRVPLKAASKTVDRAGSGDQAMRIGVTANVGGDPRRSTVSVDQLMTHTVWGYAGCLVPHRLILGQYVTVTKPGRHCRTTEVPVMSVSRSCRTSLADPCALSRPRAYVAVAHAGPSRMSGRIATLTSSSNLATIGQLSCFPGLLSTFRGSDNQLRHRALV
jgi:hypothetical protein